MLRSAALPTAWGSTQHPGVWHPTPRRIPAVHRGGKSPETNSKSRNMTFPNHGIHIGTVLQVYQLKMVVLNGHLHSEYAHRCYGGFPQQPPDRAPAFLERLPRGFGEGGGHGMPSRQRIDHLGSESKWMKLWKGGRCLMGKNQQLKENMLVTRSPASRRWGSWPRPSAGSSAAAAAPEAPAVGRPAADPGPRSRSRPLPGRSGASARGPWKLMTDSQPK